MRDWEGKFEAALRSLAESARDQAVASSGADIRRRAETRRRKRAFWLPSALLTCTLAGGTAFGLTAALGHPSPHPGASRPSPSAAQSIAPGYAGPATLAPGPASSHPGPAPAGSQPAGAAGGGGALRPLCQLTKSYPHLAYVQGIRMQPPAGVVNIIPAVCAPDPQDPSRGKLVPSGGARQVPLAPGATALVTAPIGQGTQPSPTSLTQLAFGLQQHPGALFGITFGPGGQVTRMAEVYLAGASRSPQAQAPAPPNLGSGF